MSTFVSFPEARKALLEHDKPIRHESMPEGEWIMKNYRPYGGSYILIMVGAHGNFSDADVDWTLLFWSALHDDCEDWQVGE